MRLDDTHSEFIFLLFFFFKQKTAYEMRISDWSSDVCSSDLCAHISPTWFTRINPAACFCSAGVKTSVSSVSDLRGPAGLARPAWTEPSSTRTARPASDRARSSTPMRRVSRGVRSEEPTYELQSLMRISVVFFFMKKKTETANTTL